MSASADLRVALVHHLLVKRRGGEQVLESIARLFPGAPVYTLLERMEEIPPELKDRQIRTTWFHRLPLAHHLYKPLLPIVPYAFESLDLSGFDVVVTSDSMLAKSVVTSSRTFHLCYCHSPPRYLWDLAAAYRRDDTPWLLRPLWDLSAHRLRIADFVAAQRIDAFVANSTAVAGRIAKYYGKSSHVVHPPVDTEFFRPGPDTERSDFFLFVGELVPYKRPDLLVEAFRGAPHRLRVLGDGPLLARLRRRAPPNVSIEGRRSREELREAYRRCRAFLYAGEEDFGIALVEAQACGAPVIALGRGGAVDSVLHGRTGILFGEASVDAIRRAIDDLDDLSLGSQNIREHALGFGRDRFETTMRDVIEVEYDAWSRRRRGSAQV